MKTKARRLLCFILFVILLLSLIIGAVTGFYYGGKARAKVSFKIESAKDFIDAINHSDEIKKQCNYIVVVEDEIRLDESDIPQGKSFYGKLDGQGNSIIITSENGESLKRPIFKTIMNGAVIERLSIRAELRVGDEDNKEISVLSNSNFGTIRNCSFVVNDVFIGSKCENAAVIVNSNAGEISNICLHTKFIESTQTVDNWQCAFGTVTTVNYSTVKNVFINVEFGNLVVFNDDYNNQSVGYTFGKVGKVENGKVVEKIYIFGDVAYWEYACDITQYAENTLIKTGQDKPSGNLVSEFVNATEESKESWSFSTDESTGFPKLS